MNQIPPEETGTRIDVDPADKFVKLLMEHRHRVYAFIAKQLVNAADAEDVFQKTSIVLWKKMDQYDPQTRFFSWACGIAFNEVRNFLTTKRRDRLHFDGELIEVLARESEEEENLSEERHHALSRCMEDLREPHRELFKHCYHGGNSISQVAKEIGMTRDSLYKKLARVKQKLISCIRKRLSVQGAAE